MSRSRLTTIAVAFVFAACGGDQRQDAGVKHPAAPDGSGPVDPSLQGVPHDASATHDGGNAQSGTPGSDSSVAIVGIGSTTMPVFAPLGTGTVRADGWLLKMLQFQRDGATGAAESLYSELGLKSAWLGGDAADSDWERPPYYLKGLVALAYVLDDAALKAKAQKWIDWTLASQKADGSFGPATNRDWWPRMVMMYVLKDYFEATLDPRVPVFLSKYFDYQRRTLGQAPLQEWGKARGGDNIDVVLWHYGRTGNSDLLTLADTLKGQTNDWTTAFTNNAFGNPGDFLAKHNVNVAEALKMPAIYFRRSKAAADRDAFRAGDQHLLHDHGQATGMLSGTESLAGLSSTQGVETCAVVEHMQSNEEALAIVGDPSIGDELETIAFNSLPAAFDKNGIHIHQYYTLPNQVQSVQGSRGYAQDYPNALMPGPYSGFPCCRFNMHMGWPYYVKNMWAATADGGIAAMSYGPSHLTTRVASGAPVTITETTNYPFEEQIKFTLKTAAPIEFQVHLRIPTWVRSPEVTVNGVVQNTPTPGTFYGLKQTWHDGDVIIVTFPMPLWTTTHINDSVAIHRGPLLFSLKLDEKWTVVNGSPVAGYDESTVTPRNAWNYGLLLDRNNLAGSIQVQKRAMPADDNPFLQQNTPITLTVNAKKLPSWVLKGVNADEVPASPVTSNEPVETLTLVPFGAENIRVTYFPTIGSGSGGLPSYFMIVNKNSGGCLDLINGDFADGARINQWACDPSGSTQRWAVAPTENKDHFKLISYVTGKSACIAGDATSDGAQLHDWVYTGNNPAQQFDLVDAGSGWFKIKNVRSGKVLEVSGSSVSNDAKVQQAADGGNQSNQLWRLAPWGNYFLGTNDGDYVCVANQGSRNGDRIVQQPFDPGPWCGWKLESAGEGYLKASSLNAPVKVIGVEGASTAAGHFCHLWDYDASNGGDQKVQLLPQTDGTFRFAFIHDGLSWDVSTGAAVRPLVQAASNAAASQRFKLERAP